MNGCPEDLFLEDWLLGRLDELAEAALLEHCEHCENCEARLEELEQSRSANESLRALADLEPVAPSLQLPFDVPRVSQARGENSFPKIHGFRIIGEIGRGGMGIVYEAEQIALGRRVALKLLPPEFNQDATLVRRFESEAKAAAGFHHSNIVPVFQVGRDGDSHFFAMQLIDGVGFDQVISDVNNEANAAPERNKSIHARVVSGLTLGVESANTILVGGQADDEANEVSLPREMTSQLSSASRSTIMLHDSKYTHFIRRVARIGSQIADALDYAHNRGVIHRDVKPSNLLLDTNGVPWVTDFGLAKTQDVELTQTGAVLGTIRYMSPERFAGSPCDVRGDVYSLGTTLYEMAVQRPAFPETDHFRAMNSISRGDAPTLRSIDPRVPTDFQTIIQKAMHREPDRRYSTCKDLSDDLQRFANGQPIRARRVGNLEKLWLWSNVHRALAASLALILTLLTTGLIAMSLGLNYYRQSEMQQRHLAEQNRGNLYLAEMQLMVESFESPSGIPVLKAKTAEWIPQQNQRDLRGWEWYLFDSAGRETQKVIDATKENPANGFHAIGWSADGRRLRTGGRDILHWDIDAAKETKAFPLMGWILLKSVPNSDSGRDIWVNEFLETPADSGASLDVSDLESLLAIVADVSHEYDLFAISNDSRRIICVSSDQNDARVLDILTGEFVADLPGPGRGQNCCAIDISPDGKLVAIAWLGRPDARGSVGVFRTDDWEKVVEIPAALNTWACLSIAWSPDSERLVTAADNGRLSLFELDRPAHATQIDNVRDTPFAVSWSPDGKYLAAAGKELAIRVWDMTTMRQTRMLRIDGNASWVLSLAWSPNSQRLAAATQEQAFVWDSREQSALRHLDTGCKPERPDYFLAKWSPDGESLAVGTEGTEKLTVRKDGRFVSADGKLVGGTKIFDTSTGNVIWEGHGQGTQWSHDGKYFANIRGQQVIVRDASAGHVVNSFSADDLEGIFPQTIAWHPSYHCLVVGLAREASPRRSELMRWNPLSKQTPTLLKQMGDAGRVIACWSPNGHRLLISDHGERMLVINAESGETLSQIASVANNNGVSWSDDGSRFAVVGIQGNVVRIVDATNYEVVHDLHGHTRELRCIAWHPDGSRIATAGADGTVKLWDPELGKVVISFDLGSIVNSVDWSRDGNSLAAHCTDGIVRVWTASGYVNRQHAVTQ